MTETPRGILNRNPGNIRKDGTEWDGMAAKQTDPAFVVFEDPQHGIRAMTKILLAYKIKHQCTCIENFISRWAPENENDTESYIKDCVGRTGIDRYQPLDVENVTQCLPLVKAIIQHENGQQPYSDAVLLEGMGMAGIC